MTTDAGTIRITARTLDLAREALDRHGAHEADVAVEPLTGQERLLHVVALTQGLAHRLLHWLALV